MKNIEVTGAFHCEDGLHIKPGKFKYRMLFKNDNGEEVRVYKKTGRGAVYIQLTKDDLARKEVEKIDNGEDSEYYTTKEVAIKEEVQARTIQTWCKEGKIPTAKKASGQWAIPVGYKLK